MSRRNREKRAWRCSKCKARMHRELDAPAKAGLPDGAAAIVHICGSCRTGHYFDNGRLRPLTAAEQFAVRMAIPKTMDFIDRALVDDMPGELGTIILAEE